jgi:peptidyl-prolyl cis-trans isomerase A (cyclophilin A)
VAKKKSKSRAAREAAQAVAVPAKPAGGEANVLPIAIGLIVVLAAGAWLWSSREAAEPSFRDSPRSHEDRASADAHEDEAPLPPIDPRLLTPAALTEHAPETFAVELDTTAGNIIIDVHRAWSPNGADRFYNLVRAGYYTDVAFFRVLDGFMAQCGIHGRGEVNRAWQHATIPDDPVVQHNTRGFVTFATGGPNTRTTQFFINYGDNSRLDATGFSPFGQVRDMTAVDALDGRYGEGAPQGHGPEQGRLQAEGNAYLHRDFPELDYIESARILP